MYPTIKYLETDDLLTIEVIPKMKPIIVLGLILQGLLYTSLPVGLLFVAYTTFIEVNDLSLSWFPILVVVAVFYFIAGIVYLKRVFAKEIVKVTKDTLTLEISEFFLTRKRTYKIEKIAHFAYSGREDFTRHPLAKDQYDITGLGAEESEIQYLIEKGTLTFFYEGTTTQFGKNVDSEDAEEIIRKIEKHTGNNLSSDDRTELMIEKSN